MKGFAGIRLILSCGLALSTTAFAVPVEYVLRTVTDGQLGGLTFSEALVTIRFRSDTQYVQTQVGAGSNLATNTNGNATISITQGNHTTTATFNPNEIFVRYDIGNGIVGFGSSISPTYPVAIGCNRFSTPADCSQSDFVNDYGGRDGTASALADLANASASSSGVLALPASLTQSTLLTGFIHACAAAYTVDVNGVYSCQSRAPVGLRTDRGLLYLQDLVPQTFGDYFGNAASFEVRTGVGR